MPAALAVGSLCGSLQRLGSLCFCEKCHRSLREITLNLYIVLVGMDTNNINYSRFKNTGCPSICLLFLFIDILHFSVYRSFISLVKFIPQVFWFDAVLVKVFFGGGCFFFFF